MKTLLIVITRVTSSTKDNEYQTEWDRVAQYDQSDCVIKKEDALFLKIVDSYLLVVSGTGAVDKTQPGKTYTTNSIIKRLETALENLSLTEYTKLILYHSSTLYDTGALEQFFTEKQWPYIGYNLGRQNDERIYHQLYVPLRDTVQQYLSSDVPFNGLLDSYRNAIQYVENQAPRHLVLSTLNFQNLFTAAEQEDYVFICNPENFGETNISPNWPTSSDALDALLRKGTYRTTARKFIILCELNWTWEGLIDKTIQYKGIETVKHLHTDLSLTKPVLFVSAAPEKAVHRLNDSILFAMGHHFVSLHGLPDVTSQRAALEEAFRHPRLERSLSNLELIDIQEYFCNTDGARKLFLHQLSNFQKQLPLSDSAQYQSAWSEIRTNWEQQFVPTCIDYRLLSSNTPVADHQLADLIQDCIAKLDREVGSGPRHYLETEDIERSWNVVIVDDEATNDYHYRILKTELEKYKCTVRFCRTSDETFQHLNNPKESQNTRVLIADYRLNEPDTYPKKLQAQQGYDILSHVATHKNLAMALIAFSAMPRKFLLNTFNRFGIRAEVVSKLDYFKDTSTIADFAARIVQLGDECEESLADIPQSSGWRNLRNGYIAYRKSNQRETIEATIASATNELIDLYQSGGQPEGPLCANAKPNFGDSFNEKNREAFIGIFAARRLAAYLYLSKIETNFQKIAAFIRNDENFDVGAARTFVSTTLAISFTELPYGLTMEESRFLQEKSRFPPLNFLRYSKPLYKHLENETKNLLHTYGTSLMSYPHENQKRE